MASELPRSAARGRQLWPGAIFLVGLLAAHLAAGAVPARVAIVKSNSLTPFDQASDAIMAILTADPLQPELLTFDLEGERSNAVAVLAAVHRAAPRLVIAVGSLATAAVLDDPEPLPALFSMVLYPRPSGFLDRPARQISGVSLDIPLELQFSYLRRLVPAARRVGVLYNAAETGAIIEAARTAAAAHGLELVASAVSEPAQAVSALGPLMERVEVIWAVADSHVFSPRTTPALMLAALRRRIPLIGLSTAHVRAGAVAALSVDYADVGVQTGEMALAVLRGASISALPPAAPRKVTLALNLQTAAHLGLSIAADLQREARELVQ
ncbi:MAG: hypothetical protein HY699_18805 [Deltaproteobacteria bacterium]|nr:hypothetical protein [Deltaproteobacteria bacterium]